MCLGSRLQVTCNKWRRCCGSTTGCDRGRQNSTAVTVGGGGMEGEREDGNEGAGGRVTEEGKSGCGPSEP